MPARLGVAARTPHPGCTPRSGFLRCGCNVLRRAARAARAIFLPLWRYSAVLGCIRKVFLVYLTYRRNMPLGLPRPAAEVGGASTSQNPALATLCPRWAHWHQKRNSHALNYHRARNVLEKVRRYPGAPWRGCARPGCASRAGFLRCGCSVLRRAARAARAIFLPLWRYSAVLGCI